MKSEAKHLVGILAVLLLAGCASSSLTARAPARACCEGDIWLGWNSSARLGYVRGYLEGARRGYRGGCVAFDNIAQPEFRVKRIEEIPISKCFGSAPRYSREPGFYERCLSGLYRKFPADRSIALHEAWAKLADGGPQTVEQLHQALRSRKRHGR